MNRLQIFLLVSLILVVVLLVGGGLGGYYTWSLHQKNLSLEAKNKELQTLVTTTSGDLASTTARLQEEAAKTNELFSQVSTIASTVGTLDKLSKTDKELLKKYSKIYFLNENYIPARLATITPAFLYNPKAPFLIHASVWPYLERMIVAASSSGINLQINSAYRSFGTQAALKSNYKVVFGSGANKFSADQGYSEHQLGTTVDITTPSVAPTSLNFAKTPAYDWLLKNAYSYGFILSYPKENTYYQYEPWHWRFVGVALATKLHEENKFFYNYPQRLIDTYLVNIFD